LSSSEDSTLNVIGQTASVF